MIRLIEFSPNETSARCYVSLNISYIIDIRSSGDTTTLIHYLDFTRDISNELYVYKSYSDVIKMIGEVNQLYV